MVIGSFCFILFRPVWKKVWGRLSRRPQEFAHSAPSGIKLLQQTMKRFGIKFIPLGRYCLGNFQEHLCVDFGFEKVQPRFKGFETAHLLVHHGASVKTPSRLISKLPSSRLPPQTLPTP